MTKKKRPPPPAPVVGLPKKLVFRTAEGTHVEKDGVKALFSALKGCLHNDYYRLLLVEIQPHTPLLTLDGVQPILPATIKLSGHPSVRELLWKAVQEGQLDAWFFKRED